MDRLLEVALGNAGSAVLLAVAAALASRWVRRPTVAHGLWLVVLLRLLVPPILELGVLPPAPVVTASGGLAGAVAIPAAGATPAVTTWLEPRTMAVLGWVAGSLALLALAAVRSHRLRRLLASAGDGSPELVARVAAVARTLGLTRVPRLRVVEGGTPPMIWGPLGGPSLVLPAALLGRLDERQQEALIAHELAHVKRRDHWVRHLELASTLIFWWHPVVWWARRRLHLAEELCCDALVARHLPGHRRAYAHCLLSTVRFLSTQRPVAVSGTAMASFTDLKGRITMIMSSHPRRRLPLVAKAFLALAAVTALALSPTLTARAGETPPSTAQPISLELEAAALRDVLATFSTVTGLTIAIHPAAEEAGLADDIVTIAFTDTPWDEALGIILGVHGLTTTREGDIIWVHPHWQTLGDDSDRAPRAFTGAPISLHLVDADVRDVLRTLAELTELEILMDPTVAGQVTVDLDQVPWDQALDLVLRISGLEVERRGETLVVRRASEATGEVYTPVERPRISTADDAGVFRFVVGGEISEPTRISGPSPAYPAEARAAGVEGVVVLETVIAADGSVRDVRVIRGADGGLTEAAVAAVERWRFDPARLDGEAVDVAYVLTVRFSLGSHGKEP